MDLAGLQRRPRRLAAGARVTVLRAGPNDPANAVRRRVRYNCAAGNPAAYCLWRAGKGHLHGQDLSRARPVRALYSHAERLALPSASRPDAPGPVFQGKTSPKRQADTPWRLWRWLSGLSRSRRVAPHMDRDQGCLNRGSGGMTASGLLHREAQGKPASNPKRCG